MFVGAKDPQLFVRIDCLSSPERRKEKKGKRLRSGIEVRSADTKSGAPTMSLVTRAQNDLACAGQSQQANNNHSDVMKDLRG